MKSKLDLFPSVYCVSLVESKQRRRNLISQFKEYGISDINFSLSERLAESGEWWIGDEYIDNLCNAGKSTCINHIRNIYDWYHSTEDVYGFFCEDDLDIQTVKNWNFTWSEFISALPSDWQCVQLYTIRTHDGYPITNIHLREREWYDWGAQAFIMKRSYAKKVLDAYYLPGGTFNLKSQNFIPFKDNLISPYLHRCPYPENLLFTGLGKVLNIPLFLEGIDIQTTYTNDSNILQKDGHYTSYNIIKQWWLDNQHKHTLNDLMKIRKSNRIIDCFVYYDEKELLELRIRLLEQYVDKFLIFEGDKHFCGLPKPFTCKKTLSELGLNSDKIEVVEVNLPSEEENLIYTDLDYFSYNQYITEEPHKGVATYSYCLRERIQRDYFLNYKDEFYDDDVFIFSNCDEIIDPIHLHYVPNILRNRKELVLKIPLVRLQTRANLREYNKDTNSVVLDDKGMFMCMKHHFDCCSPTQIRNEFYLPFSVQYVVGSDFVRIEDMGWHFTRQGKCNIPYTTSSLEVRNFSESFLPKILFDLERVKTLLLPPHNGVINNKLHDLPCINVISLKKDIQNRDNIVKIFNEYNITNINFNIDITEDNLHINKGLSISINHVNSIRNWFNNTQEEYGFFCEDDLSLETVKYWFFTWKDFIDSLPPNWQCIQLTNIRTQYNEIQKLKIKGREWYDWGAQAFIMKRSYAEKMLMKYPDIDSIINAVDCDTAVPECTVFTKIDDTNVYTLPLFTENYNPKHEHFINVVLKLWKEQKHSRNLKEMLYID